MNNFNKKVFWFTIIVLLIIAAVTVFKIYGGNKEEKQISPPAKIITEKTEIPSVKSEDKVVIPADDKKINDTDIYTGIISEHMEKVQGDCQWGYYLFPENIGYCTESFPAPSASIIKVFIMEYAFNLAENGKLDLNDTTAGQTVSDLIYSMITISDNDATNILISRFGMDEMNNYFQKNGYTDTVIQRKMLDTVAQSEGKDNYTSLNDVTKFLKKLYSNRDKKPYSDMLDIMKQQQVSTKIRRNFAPGTVIANKTGELSDVENDIGIIFGEDKALAVAFLCSSLPDTVSARWAVSNSAFELAEASIFEKNN